MAVRLRREGAYCRERGSILGSKPIPDNNYRSGDTDDLSLLCPPAPAVDMPLEVAAQEAVGRQAEDCCNN